MTDTDWGAFYERGVTAVADLPVDPVLELPVPATPAWTVHQVLAHLAGVASDRLEDRMDGAPTPEWTARHVGEREGRTSAALVAELQQHAPQIAERLAGSPRPAQAWDLAVHLADLHEALELGRPDPEHWEPVLGPVATMCLGELAVAVVADGDRYGAADPDAPVVEVAGYELFRALFSRRSRTQMAAWAAPHLSPEQLDALPVFGPRDDDQPVPES